MAEFILRFDQLKTVSPPKTPCCAYITHKYVFLSQQHAMSSGRAYGNVYQKSTGLSQEYHQPIMQAHPIMNLPIQNL
jgi:hypothetical protein